MRRINNIISKCKVLEIIGSKDAVVKGVHFDSRKVESGFMFIAVPGTIVDGHEFIPIAIENGATAIICENLPDTPKYNVTYIKVENSAVALGQISSEFFDNPSEKLNLVGVTGTNGKTTTATLLYHMFTRLGYKCGLLSTVKNIVVDKVYPASHTTPDSIQINYLMDLMVEARCEFCFMEVSSHAIDQSRIHGLDFKGGIFTNITHDHLDYHKTFKDYLYTKKKFFDYLPENAFALVNRDDKNGEVMLQNTKANKLTYSIKSMADYKANIVENDFSGMQLKIQDKDVWARFIGEFNAYNLLSVYATSVLLGQSSDEVLEVLSGLEPVEGRFNFVVSKEGKVGIVDYAHTPDALENVLDTILKIRKKSQKVITVVGAGGDRDKTKRPKMAKIAADRSDKVILTSDNPRTENPNMILQDMNDGVPVDKKGSVITIENRKEAIKTACMLAGADDIILVAGKGHETYQEINGVKYDFDDKLILMEIFNQ